jgi:hypothetical protein
MKLLVMQLSPRQGISVFTLTVILIWGALVTIERWL